MKVEPGDRIYIWSDDGRVMMEIRGRNAAEHTLLYELRGDLGCDITIDVAHRRDAFDVF